MTDLERLLIRREDFEIPGRERAFAGSPAFVGKVKTSSPASGKFLLVNPVQFAGAEVEGGSSTDTVDTSTTIAVYPIGPPPAANDLVLCEWADHRWVAERRPIGGTTGTINIPGCLCQGTPGSLSLTITYAEWEDSHSYSNAYQDCSFAWYTLQYTYKMVDGQTVATSNGGTKPGYLPDDAYQGPGYYSTTSWVDDFGNTDYFRLNCYTTQYALAFGQNSFGTWQAPVQIYTWSMGGSPALNTCSPFALNVGRSQQGVAFYGKIVILG